MKTIVITGVTSGVGRALVEVLCEKGEKVIGVGRSPDKLDRLKNTLEDYEENLHLYQADLSDMATVNEVINRITDDFPFGIDVLINNAAIVPKYKRMSTDGFELQYQVNHLMPLYFSHRLEPLLRKRKGTIITTSSGAHKKAAFDKHDLQALKKYHAVRSYTRTKLYNLMIAQILKEKYHPDINVFTVHPGRVKTEIGTKDTSLLYAFLWRLFTRKGFTPREATKTYLYLIYGQTVDKDALYFYDAKPASFSSIVNVHDSQELYTISMRQLNLK